MNRYILILFLSFLSFSAFSQKRIVISGLVKDKLTDEPLIGANIIAGKNGNGTSSDAYGFYSVGIPKNKKVVLIASYVGYKPFRKEIDLTFDLRFDILMEPGVEIEAVNITAGKPIEERIEMGAVEIPVKQIKNMPMLGEPDVLKTMQLLPGVQGGSDGRSNLFVRGGSPDQNLFMLDGTPLYYVNHLGGFVSVFNPDILKNIKLYKGGFPARFGGRLSSVIDLRLKEGNKKEFHGSYGIGLISGDITLEGPIKTDKTSFIVSFRRVWIDFLLRPATKIAFKQASMGYNFYDFYGKISHEIDSRNRLYLSVYGGDDKLGYFYYKHKEKIKSNTKYIWGNILSTLRWNRIYSSKLNSDVTLFYTRYRYKNRLFFKSPDSNGENLYTTAVHDFGIKADFNWYLSNNYNVRFGGGLSEDIFVPGQINYYFNEEGSVSETVVGNQNRTQAFNLYFYAENEFSPFSWFSLNFGLRAVNYQVDGKNYFSAEPRLISNFNLGKLGAVKLGYTKMMQPAHMLTYTGSSFPTDIWLPSTAGIPPGEAIQYSVGYSKSFIEGTFELSIELYKKEMKNLLTIKGGVPLVNSNPWEQNVERNGIGNSKGVELLLQKKEGRTTGWISYTLSKADRLFENVNNGISYPFKYDRRHDFSIVISRQVSKNIDCSATWVYGSGYPTTLYNGRYKTITLGDNNIVPGSDLFNVNGYSEGYLYPGKNWLRMRDYHRLDLGINFHKEITGKRGTKKIRTWTIGVYNAYCRQNAVYYYFDYEYSDYHNPIVLYQQSGFPIIPTIKYSVKF